VAGFGNFVRNPRKHKRKIHILPSLGPLAKLAKKTELYNEAER